MSQLNQFTDSINVGDIIKAKPNLTSIPNGYLKCDGSDVSIAKYPNLRTMLSTDVSPRFINNNCTNFNFKLDTFKISILSDNRILIINNYNKSYFGTINDNTITWVESSATPTTLADVQYVLLSDERILAFGGKVSSTVASADTYFGTISGNTISWVAGTALPVATSKLQGTLLSDGRILINGGQIGDGTKQTTSYIGTISGNTISWVASTAMPNDKFDINHPTQLLPDGRVLCFESSNPWFGTISGTTITWAAGSTTLGPVKQMGITVLPDGRLFIIGGVVSLVDSNLTYFGTISGDIITWDRGPNLPIGLSNSMVGVLSDGRVCSIGGDNGTNKLSIALLLSLNAFELPKIEPKVNLIPTTGAPLGTATATGLYAHATTILADGRILVTGGINSAISALCYIGTPNGNTIDWVATTSLPAARESHRISTLPDGRVLITGGFTTAATNVTYFGTVSGDTITWTAGTAFPGIRYNHSSIVLADGRAWIFGGNSATTPTFVNTSQFGTLTYDGTTTAITWVAGTQTGGLTVPTTSKHTTTLLPDGRILLIGGGTATHLATTYFGTVSGNNVTWVAGNAFPEVIGQHQATLLADGRIFVCGGWESSTYSTPTARIGKIKGNTITWTPCQGLSKGVDFFTLNKLSDGRIVILGGETASGVETSLSYISDYFPTYLIKT